MCANSWNFEARVAQILGMPKPAVGPCLSCLARRAPRAACAVARARTAVKRPRRACAGYAMVCGPCKTTAPKVGIDYEDFDEVRQKPCWCKGCAGAHTHTCMCAHTHTYTHTHTHTCPDGEPRRQLLQLCDRRLAPEVPVPMKPPPTTTTHPPTYPSFAVSLP